jgi:hypothetical protein
VAGSSGQEVWVCFSFFSCSTSSFCETDSPLEQQPPRRSRQVWDGWPVLLLPHCIRLLFAYTVCMSVAFRETEPRPWPLDRYVSTVTIAAAIFVAIRLAKVKDIELNVPMVLTTIQQGVKLARTILDEARRR